MWRGTLIGSGSEGVGASIAMVDVALGDDTSPVAAAWLRAFSGSGDGQGSFVVCAEPGVAVRPHTLFVPKVAISGREHFELTVGAAHAGVALGVIDALRAGVIPLDVAERAFLICSVWVDASASSVHHDLIVANNRSATFQALDNAGHDWPPVSTFVDGEPRVRNQYHGD